MSIRKGPMLERFAAMIGCKTDEVVEWANQYIERPRLACQPEPTEDERTMSIKGYIQWRVDGGINGRIRNSLAMAAADAARDSERVAA